MPEKTKRLWIYSTQNGILYAEDDNGKKEPVTSTTLKGLHTGLDEYLKDGWYAYVAIECPVLPVEYSF